MNRSLLVLPLAALALAGCAGSGDLGQTAAEEAPGGESSAQVEVSKDVSILRATLTEASGDALLRVEVTNAGADDDTLRAVSGAGHDPVDAGPWTVPAEGVLHLGLEGTAAVVLPDTAGAVAVGDVVEVTFVFDRSGEITVTVPVTG
ncbi:MAG: hypothetical protein JWQ53_2021 [Klenkia sp.]|nr:hypothetical protein [Klenkia sp.]